jgi:flagellar M-ring protein FliF
LINNFKNQWSTASPFKRISFLIGLIALVAMLVISSLWVFHDDYQVLFSDLNAQDASAMLNELERLKVPYQLADDGTTILVERDAVYKTRLKLMGKGLNLQGSVGFEIFNNAEFGMTEFAQKVNYQRALQGELARTIMGFDEIKSARVHLVLPETGLFKRQSAKPKASVSVVMKTNAMLNQGQIAGIQRLVAASVPEISVDQVTVMDQRGVAVSKQLASDGDEAKLSERLDMKKQLEDYMTRKIMAVVDKAVGPGKAIVSVDVTLNYDQIKVVKEDIVPLPNTSGQEVGAITRRRETSQGNDWPNGANVTSVIQEKVGSASTELDFANSRHVEQILSSPGNILRLNVGVLLPDTPDKIKTEKLKEVISMTAGINLSRGDGLAVYGIDLPSDITSSAQESGKEATLPTPHPIVDHKQQGKLKAIAMDSNEFIWVVVGILAIVGFILISRLRNKNRGRLSVTDREKMLEEISRWAKTQTS